MKLRKLIATTLALIMVLSVFSILVLADVRVKGEIEVCPANTWTLKCLMNNLFSTLFVVSSDATYLGTITCQGGSTCLSDTSCSSVYTPGTVAASCNEIWSNSNQGSCEISGTQPVIRCYYSSSASTSPTPTPTPAPAPTPTYLDYIASGPQTIPSDYNLIATQSCSANSLCDIGGDSCSSSWESGANTEYRCSQFVSGSYLANCRIQGTSDRWTATINCYQQGAPPPVVPPIGCAYNEFRCNENKQEWCNINGQWEYIQTCRSGTYCYKSSSTVLDCKNTTPIVCGFGKKECSGICIWTWETCGTTPPPPPPTRCSAAQKLCGDKCIYTWQPCELNFPLPDECKSGSAVCIKTDEATNLGFSDCESGKFVEGEFVICDVKAGATIDTSLKKECLANKCDKMPNECVGLDASSTLHQTLRPMDSICYQKNLGNKCIPFPNEYECTKDYGIIAPQPIFGNKPDGCMGSVCTSYAKCLEKGTEVKSKDDGMARCCEKEVTEVKERFSLDSKFYCGKESDIKSKCQIGFDDCMAKTGSSVNCGIDRVVCEEQNIEQKYGIIAVIFIAILLLKLIP